MLGIKRPPHSSSVTPIGNWVTTWLLMGCPCWELNSHSIPHRLPLLVIGWSPNSFHYCLRRPFCEICQYFPFWNTKRLYCVLQINKELNIDEISQFAMSWLRKKHHLNVDVQKKGFTFAKCIVCESLKDLVLKVGKSSASEKEVQMKLKRHNKHQKNCRALYQSWKRKSVWLKEEFLCVIHDKMDHSKTTIPRLEVKNKITRELGWLLVMLIGMIVHEHGDEAYIQYSNELWPNDPNFTIGSLLRLLRTLEKELVHESRQLFKEEFQNEFFSLLMWGKSRCVQALKAPKNFVGAKLLPQKLLLQMDNCMKDNNNRYLWAFLSLLIVRDVFEEAWLGFLVVGHTHKDINGCFGYLSKKLKE